MTFARTFLKMACLSTKQNEQKSTLRPLLNCVSDGGHKSF